ncbi:MAG: hypothetical protein ACE5EX_10780 [Phycisphaerae bacterium]
MAVALLSFGAVLAGPVARWMNVTQQKLPLPLKSPLDALDETGLRPYRVVRRTVLDPAVVNALGTEQYIQWMLEDTEVAEHDPRRFGSLLVTYYTGGNNLVPHTPDVCRLGSGYNPAQPHENREITIGSDDGEARRVPVRVLTFGKTAIFGREKVTVVYTFYCNGVFMLGSHRVRIRLNTPTHTYAYFSKVEVSFPLADREQNILAARKLFSRLIPLLVRDHWPDFQAAEEKGRNRFAPRTPEAKPIGRETVQNS